MRPTKLTDDVAASICVALRAGQSLADAARAVRLAPSTVREWLARGRGQDPDRPATEPFITFAQAVDASLPRLPRLEPLEFPDITRDRARACEQDEAPIRDRVPLAEAPTHSPAPQTFPNDPRVWRSKASRRREGRTAGLMERVF